MILFVYLLTTVALPVFVWRRHRESFSAVRHAVNPLLAALTLIIPFVEEFKPGQPAPYSASGGRFRPVSRAAASHERLMCASSSSFIGGR